jgi:hypothetical protein
VACHLAKKEHKSFQSVAFLFSLTPNPSTLFFYAPYAANFFQNSFKQIKNFALHSSQQNAVNADAEEGFSKKPCFLTKIRVFMPKNRKSHPNVF